MRVIWNARLKAAIEWHLDRLGRYETYIGGWIYYDFDAKTQQPSMGPTSFGTAAGLVALKEAKAAGIDVPDKMIQRAIRRLQPEPVDDETVLRCIELAMKAPTAGNRQSWEWIVVRDPDIRHQLARAYRQGWSIYRRVLRSRSHEDALQQARQRFLDAEIA